MHIAPACRCERQLVFEPGICFRCGRMLEPELGEGVYVDGTTLLLGAVFATIDRMRAEAAAGDVTYDEFKTDWQRRHGCVRAPAAPSCATIAQTAPA